MLSSVKKETKTYSVHGEWPRTTTQKVNHQGQSVELAPRTMPLFSCTRKEQVEIVPSHSCTYFGDLKFKSVRQEKMSPPISAPQEWCSTAGGSERDVVDHHHLPLQVHSSGFGMMSTQSLHTCQTTSSNFLWEFKHCQVIQKTVKPSFWTNRLSGE